MTDRVLVTGVSGFLGGHIAVQLLRAGYSVRGSVRDPAKGERARLAIAAAGADVTRLELVTLDLLSDQGWRDAADGCRYLQHVASPFVLLMPKDKNDLIRPAVEGARRALTAAFDAGHERLVLTSSLVAIDQGRRTYDRILTEDDWSDLTGPHVNAYAESKTLAEREAWKLAKARGQRNRLVSINPGALVGPLLDDDPGTTGGIIVRLLGGKMPMAPNIILEYVDVRDVAAAHIAAMTDPEVGGKRVIIADESLSLMEVAAILHETLPELRSRLPRRELPGWMVGLLGLFDASLRDSRPFIGVRRRSDPSSGIALLGRRLTPAREAIIASGKSIVEQGLV